MPADTLRFLFLVQGEGRGHMTQAIALQAMLAEAGHQVVGVVVGTSNRREVPAFFEQAMPCKPVHVKSPNFVVDPKDHRILMWKTIWKNVADTRKYLKSLATIAQVAARAKPDVIINFYDFLGGLYNLAYRPKIRCICLAHQYLAGHPQFAFPPKRRFARFLFKANNQITAIGAHKKVALSFYPMTNHKDIVVAPPLLRAEVAAMVPEAGDYLLAYVVNHGYAEQIIRWHKQHPDTKIHCFWDKKDAGETTHHSPNLVFHKIDGQKFLAMMAGCKAYISTAGFESICEALYLGKPVLMKPVNGQYEQACNAIDGQRAGAGIWSEYFDIDRLLALVDDGFQPDTPAFRQWESQATNTMLQTLAQGQAPAQYAYRLKKWAGYPLKGLIKVA